MTYIRAWMSLKFGLIRPRTTELAALKRLKNLVPGPVTVCLNTLTYFMLRSNLVVSVFECKNCHMFFLL